MTPKTPTRLRVAASLAVATSALLIAGLVTAPAATAAPAPAVRAAAVASVVHAAVPSPSPSPSEPAAPVAVLSGPAPKISGGKKSGDTLTVKAGTWSPSGVKLAYQWLRGGKKISGATKASYRLTNTDRGAKITVAVTGTKTGSKAVTKTSAAFAIPNVFGTAPKVKITGSAVVAKKLTAKVTAAKPAGKIAYQWLKNGKAISGATGSSYTVRPTDADAKLSVKVVASKSGYQSSSASTAAPKAKGIAYPNCVALNKAYPHGVARPGARDMVSGVSKPAAKGTFFSASVYALNTGRDRDKDGIACERR